MEDAHFPLFCVSQASTVLISIEFSLFPSSCSSPPRISNYTLALTLTHHMIKMQWTVTEWRNGSHITFITPHFWCLVWSAYLDGRCSESRACFFPFILPTTLSRLQGEPEDQSGRVCKDLAVIPLPFEVFLLCLWFFQHLHPVSCYWVISWCFQLGDLDLENRGVPWPTHISVVCLQSINFYFLTWVKCTCALNFSLYYSVI